MLWLFGGKAYGFNATIPDPINDLWRYNITSNKWAFMGGSQIINDPGLYDKQSNKAWPSAREYPATWVHKGAFWLFGGTSEGAYGKFQIVFSKVT